ncbi:SLBB domain-containing protein [Sandaracinobacter sp. RS1-74]|uniref:SLBB domain-containing protein n=1 Tax=Sandaracinobacteroides sayramensis TaxID=2913411 RepID=UPI001EDC3BAD|nr:SLBB domain-containing protein [Sandaracinobacteroides sayramensis]
MTVSKRLFAAAVSVFLMVPAQAQFMPPVSAADQAQSGAAEQSGRRAASRQVAVPAVESAPFAPAVIEGSAARPAAKPAEPPQASPPPPPEPSEYERFVSDAAGTPLRRFGASLLVPGAGDFAAPVTAAVPPDYRINPGDELLLGLTGSVQASNLRLKVDNDGRIFIPRVGAVRVGGVAQRDLHDAVAAAVSRQYRGFDLTVSVAQLQGITVYVTGFAARPGSFTVSSLSTLVNAVLAAGGPSAGGSFRSIQLRRGGQLVSDFDLYDLLLKGDKSGDSVLRNGDVIYIAPAGVQVAVIGSVNQPGIFEVGAGETLEDALLYAGGINTVADGSRLMLLDALGAGNAGWQELGAGEAASRKARRGDVIRVLSGVGIARPVEQQPVLVTISGEVAKPGRYYFAPGTRLADVVEKAGGLTGGAFPFASVITRESVKAQQRDSFDRAIRDMELQLSAEPLTSVNRAQLANTQNLELVRAIVAQLRAREPDGRLVFDLPVNATTLPEELILENNDSIYVPPRPITVGVFGAVPSAASFAWREGESIGDYLKAAGGVRKMGDKGEIFVIRASGRVEAGGGRLLSAKALPGDLIYVPVDANRGEFWARMRDISGTLFGGLVGAASIKSLVE